MKYLSRVVWSEGMYLGPHHFQVQNRYFEDSIRFATSMLWYAAYGVIGCQLDSEALVNGTLALTHARGIFPDGLAFHMPEADPLPPPRNVAESFPPARDTVTVLLSVPPRRPDGLNCVMPGAASNGAPVPRARYRAESFILHDETNGRDEKPVNLGLKNIELILDTELREGDLALPIARIQRDGAGHYIFDASFVPPCLQFMASTRLMEMLQRLLEILEEKSAMFSRRETTAKRSWAEFSTREIANFWLLHTVNSALAPLRHLFYSKRGHPEELFTEMLRLGGALCTFALEAHPRELPLYNHDDLGKCFDELDAKIRSYLETIVPSQFVSIPLVKRADYFYEAEVSDQRTLARARWIFAIRSQVGEVELISRTPQLVKLCSKQFVPQLVKRALPGIDLTHLPTPPAAIPNKIDFQYFSVSRSGPCWDHIVQTRQIGLYVPGELPDPEVELLVILEN